MNLLKMNCCAVILFLTIVFSPVLRGNLQAQQSENNDGVRKELDLGVVAYNQDDYKQAEEHFRIAKTLDPKNKQAALFYAQAIYAQVSESSVHVVLLPKPPAPAPQKATQHALSEQEKSLTTQRAL